MANVVVSLRIMPKGVNIDLSKIENKVQEEVTKFGGDVGKVEIGEVAFGLKALKVIFVVDESKSDLEVLENRIKKIKGVKSCETIDVRRAIG